MPVLAIVVAAGLAWFATRRRLRVLIAAAAAVVVLSLALH